MAGLRGLAHLRRLDLSVTEVGDLGMQSLATLQALTELNLNNTIVSDAGLASLRGLKSLRKLTLNYALIEGGGLESLQALPQLEELSLMVCPLVRRRAARFGEDTIAAKAFDRLHRHYGQGLGPLGRSEAAHAPRSRRNRHHRRWPAPSPKADRSRRTAAQLHTFRR